jgi:hypothetical protein
MRSTHNLRRSLLLLTGICPRTSPTRSSPSWAATTTPERAKGPNSNILGGKTDVAVFISPKFLGRCLAWLAQMANDWDNFWYSWKGSASGHLRGMMAANLSCGDYHPVEGEVNISSHSAGHLARLHCRNILKELYASSLEWGETLHSFCYVFRC